MTTKEKIDIDIIRIRILKDFERKFLECREIGFEKVLDGILRKHLQELPQQEVETYEQGLEDGRKEILDKVEELISKIKILEITGLPLYYNIIIKQLEDVFTSYNQRGQ